MSAKQNLVGKATQRGPSRERNEDHLGTPPEWVEPDVLRAKGQLYVVADGMGGHAKGQEASRRAVSRVFHEYYIDPSPDVAGSLGRAISLANQEIYAYAQQNASYKGMGTTLTAAVVRGNELYVANVGDSRAYLVRGGVAQQLTKDHSWVQEQVDRGLLSPEQARNHPQSNVITRSLGGKPTVQVDHFSYQLQPGDRVLLCTDGLTNAVGDAELARVVSANADAQRAADELLVLADRQGRTDDAAAVVVGVAGAARGASRPATAGRRPVPVLPLVAVVGLLAGVVLYASGIFGPSAPPTPAGTASPVAVTTEPARTPSPSAEATATPISVTPSPTPVPTPEQIASPTSPPSPVLAAAPLLDFPPDDASLRGDYVELRWTWQRPLGENEYFDVRVWREDEAAHGIAWSDTISYQARGLDSGNYHWSILVLRGTGTKKPDGSPDWEPVSEESEVRSFSYSAPKPTDVPEPTGTPATTNTPAPSPEPIESPTSNPTATGADDRSFGGTGPIQLSASGVGRHRRLAPQQAIAPTEAGARSEINIFAAADDGAQSDINIRKDVDPGPPAMVLPGQPVTFTLEYGNAGDLAAEGVVITDTVPQQLEVTSVVPSTPECQVQGGTYTWTLGTLEPGALEWITITARVRSGVPFETHLVNTAGITTSTQPELSLDNNVDSATVTVGRLVSVTLLPGTSATAAPGQEVVYTNTVTNTGNATDSFNMDYTSSQDWHIKIDPSLLKDVAAGQSQPITITVSVPQDAPGGTEEQTSVTAGSRHTEAISVTVLYTTTVVAPEEVITQCLPLVRHGLFTCNDDPHEPNNRPSEATTITVGEELQGWFCPNDEEKDDYFKLVVVKPTRARIELLGVPPKSDYDLYVYDATLGLVGASNWTGFGRDEQVPVDLDAISPYYIRVYAFDKRGDCWIPYRLSISEVS